MERTAVSCRASPDRRWLPDDLRADVLLLSDVHYEPASSINWEGWLIAFPKTKPQTVKTTQRLMVKEFVSSLLQRCTKREELETEGNDATVPVTVFVLKQTGG